MFSLTSISAIACSAALYLAFFVLNDAFFSGLEFDIGVNWIFLPAGLRLLCTLLFGLEGALGLFIAGLIIIQFYFPTFDLITGIGAAFITAGAPYLVYRQAISRGLSPSLEKLTPKTLGILILIYAITSPLLHQLWFALRGFSPDSLSAFFAMFVGDLLGTLIIVYTIKLLLALIRMKQSERI